MKYATGESQGGGGIPERKNDRSACIHLGYLSSNDADAGELLSDF